MKIFWITIISTILTLQPVIAEGIDEKIDRYISPVSDFIAKIIFFSITINETKVPLIVIWLLLGAIIFTIYFKFINIRGFQHAIDIVKGDYKDPGHEGEVSHFQALVTALSGTVGLGNIAGVAIAISIGGPGATFWMIIGGLLGMSSKFTECTLGVMYRKFTPSGKVLGGPMYYISRGFQERKIGGIGKLLAGFFAIMCIGGSLGTGNMFQINQATQQFINITGGQTSFFFMKGWVFGLILAIILGIIIIGGLKQIAKVTEKIVPFMCITYVLTALIIILFHITQIPEAIMTIIAGAFSPEGIQGGIIGVMLQGFKRSTFSNEAGVGSAAIVHSAVKTNEPVTEGFVSLLEPFIDTVVICTMTALVIILTGSYYNNGTLQGIELTSIAFSSVFSWFPYLLAIAVILFAVSTAISWSYYGVQAWQYLFGSNKYLILTYQFIFCIFVVVGSSLNLKSIVNFSDSMMFAMALPNILAMYILAPAVNKELNSYWSRVKNGEIKKVTN